MKLTARDYYKANDKEFLRENPGIRDELIRQQMKCKPGTCEQCYFCKQEFDDDLYFIGYQCSIGEITAEYGKRVADCPLFEEGKNERTTGGESRSKKDRGIGTL